MPPQGFSTHPPGSRSRAPLNLPGLSKCCTHRTAAAPFGHLDPRGSSQSTCIASCQTKAAPQVLATAMATAVSGPRSASMGTGSLPHRGPGAQSNQGPRGLLLREAQATHPGPPLSQGSRLSSSLAFRGNTGALGSNTVSNRAESRFPAEAWLLAPWPRPTAALFRVQGSLAPVTCLRAPGQCPGHTWRAGLGRQGARQASEQRASQAACGAAGGARLQPARLDSGCREPEAANALRGRGGTMTWTTGSFHLAWPTAGVPGVCYSRAPSAPPQPPAGREPGLCRLRPGRELGAGGRWGRGRRVPR